PSLPTRRSSDLGSSRPFAAENPGRAGCRRLRRFLALGSGESGFLRAFRLAQASGLALQLAQVEQLGSAHLAGTHDLNLIDDLGVEWKDALDALAKADLAHGEASARAITPRDDGAFKCLHESLVAFF